MKPISESSVVSIGLVITACATVFGVGVFYGTVSAQARAISELETSHKALVATQASLHEKYMTDVASIRESIARMEGLMLGTKKK